MLQPTRQLADITYDNHISDVCNGQSQPEDSRDFIQDFFRLSHPAQALFFMFLNYFPTRIYRVLTV